MRLRKIISVHSTSECTGSVAAMASAATPVISRLLSCSVSCANKAGEIIRNVLHGGDLGIVMKVRTCG